MIFPIVDAEFPAPVYMMKKSAQLHTLRKIFLGPLHLEVWMNAVSVKGTYHFVTLLSQQTVMIKYKKNHETFHFILIKS